MLSCWRQLLVRLVIFSAALLGTAIVHAQDLQDSTSEAKYSGNFVLKKGDELPRSKVSKEYQEDISQILSDEVFGRYEKLESWRIKEKNSEDGDGFDLFPDWLKDALRLDTSTSIALASVIEFLLWSVFVGGLVFLAYAYREQIKHFVAGATETVRPDLPTSLFGIDLEQTKLPENILATALDHWNKKKHREAVALLLRASLLKVLNQYPCHLFDSDTENECVAKIEKSSPNHISAYMRKLVDLWLALAYAHRSPSEPEFKDLCSAYQELF